MGGGGQDDELAREGYGLDGEMAGDEGGVTEKEKAERWVWRRGRERNPGGGNGIKGEETDWVVVVIVAGPLIWVFSYVIRIKERRRLKGRGKVG